MTAGAIDAADGCTPIATIGRVSAVLDAFDGASRLTMAEIARRTGLSRSSTHRMVEQLVELRWLRRSGREYELGTRLVELGHRAVHQNRVHQAAARLVWDLHRATGLVVHLAILDGTHVVYLEKAGDRLGAAIPTSVGGRQPAHCTGLGKAILAYSPADRTSDLATVELCRKTNHTISTPGQLRAALDEVRAGGVAFDREECVPGFGCVAAPIGPLDSPIAAVSVCGPASRLSYDHRLATPVRLTAQRIWRNFEHRQFPRTAPALRNLSAHGTTF